MISTNYFSYYDDQARDKEGVHTVNIMGTRKTKKKKKEKKTVVVDRTIEEEEDDDDDCNYNQGRRRMSTKKTTSCTPERKVVVVFPYKYLRTYFLVVTAMMMVMMINYSPHYPSLLPLSLAEAASALEVNEENKDEEEEQVSSKSSSSSDSSLSSLESWWEKEDYVVPKEFLSPYGSYPNPLHMTEEYRSKLHPVIMFPNTTELIINDFRYKMDGLTTEIERRRHQRTRKRRQVWKFLQKHITQFRQLLLLVVRSKKNVKKDGNSDYDGSFLPIYDIGRYDENRVGMYNSDMFQNTSHDIDGYSGSRTVHLGIDLGAPIHTPGKVCCDVCMCNVVVLCKMMCGYDCFALFA